MNERKLDHVGIAVRSLELAIPLWTSFLDTSAVARDRVEDQGVEVAFIGTGPARVELLAPIRGDSPVARFLKRRGSGVHHICFEVPEIQTALADYLASGADLIDREPRRGAFGHRIAFVHPKSTNGVLIELLERSSAGAP